jgi:hypothetical protein
LWDYTGHIVYFGGLKVLGKLKHLLTIFWRGEALDCGFLFLRPPPPALAGGHLLGTQVRYLLMDCLMPLHHFMR